MATHNLGNSSDALEDAGGAQSSDEGPKQFGTQRNRLPLPEDLTSADAGHTNPRKRKRSRRDPDQKHTCTAPGCGKTYSRAEHLYRHQLNHEPKQIFHCKWPGCQRTFVRQDLCLRHEERHSSHPSENVPSKSNFRNPPHVTALVAPLDAPTPSHFPHPGPSLTSPNTGSPHRDHGPRPSGSPSQIVRSSARSGSSFEGHHQDHGMGPPPRTMQHDKTKSADSNHSDDRQVANAQPAGAHQQTDVHASQLSATYETASLPSPAWSDTSTRHEHAPFVPSRPTFVAAHDAEHDRDRNAMVPTGLQGQFTHTPSLTTEFDRWLYPDDTTAWLFGNQEFDQGDDFLQPGLFTTFDGVPLSDIPDMSPSFLQDFNNLDERASQPTNSPHPMSLSAIVDFDAAQSESTISEDKRRTLIDMIVAKFDEEDHCPGAKQKNDFLIGDQSRSTHVLSLGMIQTYLASYWSHFHPQVPILHKPTFDAEHCPNLLLVAMMALGASCLERVHGHDVTQACAELASFLAWHVRWALFKHPDFRPPAKLWMFQALILLEFYEKMYATTRTMHERAHIHHGTTLTLMRRGSFLAGKSAVDPDDNSLSETYSPRHPRHRHTQPSDAWWYAWAAKEATRRAVLAAFVMDTTHAIMFGHAAVMAVHEMRLPLPCDEELWSNTDSAAVARAEAALRAKGQKRPGFLDSLKHTLNGQKVTTNTFGRMILIAGLLSVSWHMAQRDLQVSSLGVAPAIGGEEKWKTSLKRAFNFWKRDFDESLSLSTVSIGLKPGLTEYEGNVFESRTVMHHLAHMSLHVDIVDAQIFAGAPSQLGRKVTPSDRTAAERRIREIWAPSARAREAALHALHFLRKVLTPEESDLIEGSTRQAGDRRPSTSHGGGSGGRSRGKFDYSAREDDLLNRPWILFYAALIVFCFGFALDGPVVTSRMQSESSPSSRALDTSGLSNQQQRPPVSRLSKIHDMKMFLRRVGGVTSADELKYVTRRNSCVGLLMTLRDLFMDTRWQLLHEASSLFGNCIDMLLCQGNFAGNRTST